MSEVSSKRSLTIILNEEEGQALSDLLTDGVEHTKLMELGLGELSGQLMDLFPLTKNYFVASAL